MNMSMKQYFAGLLLLTATYAQASNWTQVAVLGATTFYIDPDTVKTEGQKVTVLTKTTFPQGSFPSIKDAAMFTIPLVFDCAHNTGLFLSMSIFDANDKLVLQIDKPSPAGNANPGTLSANAMLYLCKTYIK
jgi:hypothetical protein